jgi:hypothetical protein
MNLFALSPQQVGQPFDVTAFTGTVYALESDEFALHFPPL